MDLRRGTGGGDFERYRVRLFGVAYRMLGSIADAEDVLQTTYLRWHEEDTAGLRNPESWLMAVATRLSIDRLRDASRERERSPGDWLSEPIASRPDDAEQRTLLSADLSMAFAVLLERLSPEERTALLLRDVFEAGYGELARVLDRTEVSCRQLVHRAREHARDHRRRRASTSVARRGDLLRRFLAGLQAGDKAGLLSVVGESTPLRIGHMGVECAEARHFAAARPPSRLGREETTQPPC